MNQSKPTLAEQIEELDGNYNDQADLFLAATGTAFHCKWLRFGSMPWDTDGSKRDIYEVRIENKQGSYKCEFGQSIVNSGHWHFHNRKGCNASPVAIAHTQLSAGRDQFAKDTEFWIASNVIDKDGIKDFNSGGVTQGWELNKNRKAPTPYDFFAGLDPFAPIDDIDEFVSYYGYEDQPVSEYPKIRDTFDAVKSQVLHLLRMFSSEEVEALSVIS